MISPVIHYIGGDAASLVRNPATAPTAADVGSKAALLWRMSRLGLTVPPAFVLSTSLCGPVNRAEPAALDALEQAIRQGIGWLEEATGRRVDDTRRPLLVSERSGAARSMPGMLSTVLDVGLNGETVRGLIALTGNPRLAWDSYRRFVQAYAEVVGDMTAAPFETRLEEMIRSEQVANDRELDSEALERLTRDFLAIAARGLDHAPPHQALPQLTAAARAVYRSWNSNRAVEYRRLNRLDDLAGTAVTVQAMVFGNAGPRSGAGVAFSRNPATGEKAPYIDFLFDAQGEDVVAGRRMPENGERLAERLPHAAGELVAGMAALEREFRDIQDVEFTIEDGKLFFLQTRDAKRTPRAALRVLVELVREGLIDRRTALERAAAIELDRAAVTRFAGTAAPAASALSAAPGVATGRVAFSSERAKALAAAGDPVILARGDTSTEDIAGFAVAAGILTAVGGRTAHAAVVARQLGKPCLVGCHALKIAATERTADLGNTPIVEGDWLSLDGDRGEVSVGRRDIIVERPEAELAEIERWRLAEASRLETA
jgi:pyruvate,orthophosphate dikinase